LNGFKLKSNFNVVDVNNKKIFLKMIVDGSKISKPNVIVPADGTRPNIDKFLMMYTCKICTERNAQMVKELF
jgi:hypothetical protein